MTAIIDYDAGNIKSVQKALQFLGEEAIVTRDPNKLLSAERVILPGVGSFGDAMQRLSEYGLVRVIRDITERQIPLLGICLGLQLLFESSEESEGIEGLGILKGTIVKIPDGVNLQGEPLKVPHIGWNSLRFPKKGRLFEGIPKDSFVYFVHSYYLKATEEIVTAQTEYGVTMDVSVEKGNVFACQFHPEKSSETGLRILKNFLGVRREEC